MACQARTVPRPLPAVMAEVVVRAVVGRQRASRAVQAELEAMRAVRAMVVKGAAAAKGSMARRV